MLAVSQTWAPLLLVSAPALLPFVTGRRRMRFLRGNRMMWAAVAVFAILAILALWRVFVALTHMTNLRFLITATGGITGTPPIPTFALLILGLYLTVSFKTLYGQAGSGVGRSRVDAPRAGARGRAPDGCRHGGYRSWPPRSSSSERRRTSS